MCYADNYVFATQSMKRGANVHAVGFSGRERVQSYVMNQSTSRLESSPSCGIAISSKSSGELSRIG